MSATPDITGTEGERLDATVTVDSTFSTQQTQTIELRVEDGGSTVHTDTQSVTLADNTDSQQITLSWPTSSGDAGTYDLFIESEQDTLNRTVAVESAGATRQDAIAAADTWWEPSTSGWNSVKGRPAGSGSGTFVADHFGTGLDARRADGTGTEDYISAGEISLPFVVVGVFKQESPVGYRLCGVGVSDVFTGHIVIDDAGELSDGTGTYIRQSEGFNDVKRIGPELGGSTKIYAQKFTTSDTEELDIDFSASASLSYVTSAPRDFDFVVGGDEVSNSPASAYHSELAIVEGTTTIPQDIKDYFTNNYGGS